MGIFRQLTQPLVQNNPVAMEIVPADATIAELEQKAADCEEKAKHKGEPEATSCERMHAAGNEGSFTMRTAFWRVRTGARITLFLVPMLIGVRSFVSFAQEAQPVPPPKISIEVKLVQISATVRDKHNEIVPTLSKGDFAIYEDGRPQTIRNFMRQGDLPLTLGLLVETSLGPRRRYALHNVSDASYTFLDQVLREDKDQALVIRFDREVELLQDFTSSRPKLHEALQLIQTTELSGAGRGSGSLLYDAVCSASTELMKSQQGRKALFVLSDGIDQGSKEALQDAVEAAQRADISVYSLLIAENWPGPNGKKTLERISTETGGRMFKMSNRLTAAQIYAQAEEELRSQYILGYTPTPANAGAGYHKIHLATKQEGLTVQARDGYYSGR